MSWLVCGLALAAVAGCKSEEVVLSASAENGQQVFEQHCAVCHQIESGGSSQTAPSLKNVFGRKAGTAAFNFSGAFKTADFVWDRETMLAFLQNPRELVPDNNMAFYGLNDPEARENLVEFMAFHSDSEG